MDWSDSKAWLEYGAVKHEDCWDGSAVLIQVREGQLFIWCKSAEIH